MASTASKKVQQPEWFEPISKPQQPLKIYNSLTRTKNEFIPLKPGHISWYSCGPTVYDHSHMGHARNYVSTDICRRILQDYFGYTIDFIQNVTDIDDKIIIAARQDYLFKSKIVNQYHQISPELIEMSKNYLNSYIGKNLPQFDINDIDNFIPWTQSLNIKELAKETPKLPMYINASTRAYNVIYENSSTTNLENFLKNIKDVAMPALDAQYGSSITDNSIFRTIPYFWENKYNQDMAKLNVLPPTVTTRVTEYVPEIIEFVDKIVENGYAYLTQDGSVYFDTIKFENHPNHNYAKLQPWNKGDMSLIDDGEGSLTSGSVSKKNPADFALWKSSKPGEPSWKSKWGEGRPGWHIECSVMASDILGEVIDIHSGGVDLCFPHHDNELAQSEACFDSKQWINYFMHNGHLHIEGQKMSKSLKNFITIEEALEKYTPRQLRLVFASTTWDKPLDFKESLIQEVSTLESTISKFFTNVRALNNDYNHKISNGELISKKLTSVEKKLYQDLRLAQDEVHNGFCDSLSSPQALRAIQDLITKSNNYIQLTSTGAQELRIEVLLAITRWIVKILNVLGFETRKDQLGWEDSNQSDEQMGSIEDIVMPYAKSLASFRDTIRNLAISKSDLPNFLQACDSIRAEILNLGISLDDRPNGKALVKFLNESEKDQLIKQQQLNQKLQAEKEEKKRIQAELNIKKEQEKLAKMKVDPKQMFQDKSLYSEWDDQGIPTKDIQGEEITKSMKKKLLKQYQQQEKLHQEYLKSIQTENSS